jgi:ribosomal protein S11
VRKNIFVNFLKRKNLLNLFYRNFYYIAFIKRKKSNIYITITNRHGDVIIAQSFGKIGLYARKQRKIQEPYKALFAPVFSSARKLNIYKFEYMYFTFFTKKTYIEVKKAIRGRFLVKRFKNYLPIPHNNRSSYKLKRIRRI